MAVRRTHLARACAVLPFLAVIDVSSASADPSVTLDRLDVVRGMVVATCRLQEAFEPGTRASIERGLPITVRYTIDLWRDRRNWMDKQVDSHVRSLRVRYHPGERVFSVAEGERTDRRQTFETLDQALAEVSTRVLPVHPRWELNDGDLYFVAVEAAIQPLTWSEFQELDGWLSGKIRGGAEPSESDTLSTEESDPGVSRAVFDFLVDLSGFGDSYARTRTPSFRPRDLPALNP
jgi:hypothetical protein